MKLLIVDDEQRIVEYLKHILDWQGIGFNEVIGLSSGTEAAAYLLANKPELLITDIRMPKITGLDLAKLTVEHHLQTKVIVLSGYSDFTYAQKAIRLGTLDYLLKPISNQELLPVVNRALISLKKHVHKKKISKDDSSIFFVQGISTLSKNPTLFFEDSQQRLTWTDSLLPGTIQLKLADKYLTIFDETEATSVPTQDSVTFSKKNLQQIFLNYYNVEAKHYEFPKTLHLLIKEKRWPEVVEAIQLSGKKVSNKVMFQIDLLQLVSEDFPNLLKTFELSEILVNDKVESFVSDFIKEVTTVYPEKRDANQVSVDKIVTFIRENYGQEITLEGLSQLVYMHPVTISRVFKATTGSTVTAFVAKVRMEAAADLLEHSNLLVGDIGQLVGYQKTQYFINLFKKKYGITPQKYRRKILLERE